MPCSNANDWGRESLIHFCQPIPGFKKDKLSVLVTVCDKDLSRQTKVDLIQHTLYDVAQCLNPCVQAFKQRTYTYTYSTDCFKGVFLSSLNVYLPVSALTQYHHTAAPLTIQQMTRVRVRLD